MSVTDNHYAKLCWNCRRGMLELDLLLIPFAEKVYPSLQNEEQQLFEKLLIHHDQALYNWFIKREAPEDPSLDLIIKRILTYAENQS